MTWRHKNWKKYRLSLVDLLCPSAKSCYQCARCSGTTAFHRARAGGRCVRSEGGVVHCVIAAKTLWEKAKIGGTLRSFFAGNKWLFELQISYTWPLIIPLQEPKRKLALLLAKPLETYIANRAFFDYLYYAYGRGEQKTGLVCNYFLHRISAHLECILRIHDLW